MLLMFNVTRQSEGDGTDARIGRVSSNNYG